MDDVLQVPSALESFLINVSKIVNDSSGLSTSAHFLQLVDTLEIDVRQQCMERVIRSTRKDEGDSMHCDIYSFWYQILQGVHSIVQRIEGLSSTQDAADLHMNGTATADEMRGTAKKKDHTTGGVSFPSSSFFWKLTDASWLLLVSILSPLRKIPVLLLEDITELLTIESAYQFWRRGVLQRPFLPSEHATENGMPRSQSLLFSPVLWDLSKSPSRNYSSTAAPNPCWLPFLKIANTLIRRLQICGPLTIMTPADGTVAVTASVAISEIVLLLSTIYPLTEKSATRAWGSFNEHHVTAIESELEFSMTLNESELGSSPSQPPTAPTQLSISSEGTGTDYSFYQDFWMIQHDFRNPNGIIVSDFLRRLKLILHTLESRISRKSPTMLAAVPSSEHRPLQYLLLPFLTQSRILEIQLQDVAIRNIILLQICIVIHHLVVQVPQLRAQLQTHLSMITGNDFSTTNHHYLSRISHVFDHSEAFWRQWKQNKCLPDLEKQRKKKSESSATERPRKRQRVSSALPSANHSSDWIVGNDLQNFSKSMRMHNVPVLHDYLNEYVEALDPDAGIEAEYHPKNDSVFTWRALRLFAFGSADNNEQLSEFHRISPQGDFENMLRHIYETEHKISIPGEGLPLYEYVSDEDDNDENKNELTKSNDTVDDSMEEDTEDKPHLIDTQQISQNGNGSDEKEIIERADKDTPMSTENTEKQNDSTVDLEPPPSEPEKAEPEKVDEKVSVNGADKANVSKLKVVQKVAEESKPRSSQPLISESDNAKNENRGVTSQRPQDRNRLPAQHSRDMVGSDRGQDKYWSRDGSSGYNGVDGPVSRARADASSRDSLRGHSRDDMHRNRDDYHRRGAGADSASSMNEPRRDDGEWRSSTVGQDYPHGRSNINGDRGRDMNRGGANIRSRSGGGGWRSNEGSSSRR
jgi:THO complex subunit 1